jgi:hypothetical protein
VIRHRIVFLDFDGVLNSRIYMESMSDDERGSVVGLDRAAVARLNRLLREAKAHVVVSSTWRLTRDCAQLARALGDRGFDGQLLGKTPRAGNARGHQIQAWLDAAPEYNIAVESFVVIDDDSADMGHLDDRLIKTTFEQGLQDEHVDRAVTMLSQPMPLIVTSASDILGRIRWTP